MTIYLEEFLRKNEVNLDSISNDRGLHSKLNESNNDYWFDVLTKDGYQPMINGDREDTNHIHFHHLRQQWVELSKGKDSFYNRVAEVRFYFEKNILTPYEAILKAYGSFDNFHKSGDLNIDDILKEQFLK